MNNGVSTATVAPTINRTGVVLTCIGAGLAALCLILLTVFMIKLGDHAQLAPYRTVLMLAVTTFGAVGATAVVSVVVGCWWLNRAANSRTAAASVQVMRQIHADRHFLAAQVRVNDNGHVQGLDPEIIALGRRLNSRVRGGDSDDDPS